FKQKTAYEIGGMAAQFVRFISGDFSGAGEIGRQMKADAAAARAEIDKLSSSLLGLTNSRAQAGRGFVNPQLLGPVPDFKKQLTGLGGDANGGALTELQKQHNAYIDLVASINEKIAADDLQTSTGRALTESEKTRLEIQKPVDKQTITEADATSAATQAQ